MKMENVVSINRPTWRAVRELHEQAEQMKYQTVEVYAQVGDMLIELKGRDDVKHGNFMQECAKAFYGENTVTDRNLIKRAADRAGNYMRLAQHRIVWQGKADSLNGAMKLLPKVKRAPRPTPAPETPTAPKAARIGCWLAVEQNLGKLPRGYSRKTLGDSPAKRAEVGAEFGEPIPDFFEAGDPRIERLSQALMRCWRRHNVGKGEPPEEVDTSTLTRKERSVLDKALKALQHSYEEEISKRVAAEVEKRLPKEEKKRIDIAKQATASAKMLEGVWRQRMNKVKFGLQLWAHNRRMLFSILHPDRAPEGYADKFTKAATALNRIDAEFSKIDLEDWSK
jgi:hypothetical protein